MFRRNKEDKTKLEHKLYLAREAPEPIFDLSECGLRHVPHGIYSLCRVFLKEVLRLDRNNLTSLSGGGQLKDLMLLKVLDLHNNAFVQLPEDIQSLSNLKELYLNNNQLKRLPDSICILSNLVILNLANNHLKALPSNFGNLRRLRLLSLNGNKHLKILPQSMYKNQNLIGLEADAENYKEPPCDIVAAGGEATVKYFCNGQPFVGPVDSDDTLVQTDTECEDQLDAFEAKIWKLENIKKQRLQDFLEMEKANELMQQQEFELANSQKINKEKLLADIAEQQNQFDLDLIKLQQEREVDKFRLIEQLLEAEQNADIAIKQLLQLTSEPMAQLLEQEKEDEERLLAAANKYTDLRKTYILASMQELLQQEIENFEQYHQNREEVSKSVLEQETQYDCLISEVLKNQNIHQAELIVKLQEDSDLQKAAVGTLLERGDARSWGLMQQVRLVESQLAALTHIEMDKRKLQIDHNLNDLAEKRINLSFLLIDLLDQQKERREQLLATLQILENTNDQSEDFWLKQYQRLLEKLPEGLSESQRNMDAALLQILLMNGVINYVPFLAKLTQSQCDVNKITEQDLKDAGIIKSSDRVHIMDAFQIYRKQQEINKPCKPTAPVLPVEEASAPPIEQKAGLIEECVICMDKQCEVIYVPCGHFCCCSECQINLVECPMCRTQIERKIRVIPP